MERNLAIITYLLARLVVKLEGIEPDKLSEDIQKRFPKPKKITPIGEKIDAETVDRIYALYPTKCPISGRSTGKSAKDKVRISKLLMVLTEEQFTSIIKQYLEESQKSVSYIKNFSTFLNNIPDYGQPQPMVQKQEQFINAYDLVGDW